MKTRTKERASILFFFHCFTLGPTFRYIKEFGGASFNFHKEKGYESSMVKLKQNHKQKCEVKLIFTNEKKMVSANWKQNGGQMNHP